MKLFEMEGFLRGKCFPGDMKVNETNAEYLVRKFKELEQKLAESQREFRAADATIENLQMQFDAERESKLALAAENAGLKSAIETHKHGFVRCNCCGDELMCHTDDVCRALDETPATDVFLAELRASAIEHAASERWGSGYVFDELNEIAAQIRKGVQS